MTPFPYVIPLAVFTVVVLIAVLLTSRRRLAKRITCPRDEQPRDVVLSGDTLDPERWKDVLSCGRPGEAPLTGRQLQCDRACLHDPANAPERDLKETPP